MTEGKSRTELNEMLKTLHEQRDRAGQLQANTLVLRLTDDIDEVRSAIATIDILERVSSRIS